MDDTSTEARQRAMLPPPLNGRPFTSRIPATTLDDIQGGVMRSVYRGVPFQKSPFDIALYLQLLSALKPATVIEIGARFGGSALWFADMLTAQGIEGARVLAVDTHPEVGFTDPRITLMVGDANDLGAVLGEELLAACKRPFLVVEDSSHFHRETTSVLDFFHDRLAPGDYIVVEDGVLAQFSNPFYERYESGPNRGVSDFLARHPGAYALDEALCDFYGFNATYNPNGWLRRL